MVRELDEAALEYHREPVPGKLAIAPTKPLENQSDLALAYSPGVAAACRAIAADPNEAATLTNRANLVAVVTNGTAVLGLGPIGPLAAKPVMEGKAVLFKKFARIDAIDIEIDAQDPERVVDIVSALEPSFGGINLEDFKAPECFDIEERLRERMKIPVFHDDQHGTAIIVSAAVTNAIDLLGKSLDSIKLVTSGAGAAALSCLNLLVSLGLPRENVWVTDIHGVVYEGREIDMDPRKARFAQPTTARTLAEVMDGADVFLGLSAGGVLKPEMVSQMAKPPIVLALANPEPEIRPEKVQEVAPDAIIATGRTDYPNQVNNVLCFPFIFRGALDVGATTVTESMKVACVRALAELARSEVSDVVADAYGDEELRFGPDYIIPKPFDPRLLAALAPAVAKAAMDDGVATRPILDLDGYAQKLEAMVWRSGLTMRPLFREARHRGMRLVYAEGTEPRVLRAVQQVVDNYLGRPILIGRPHVIRAGIEELGLRLQEGRDYEVVNPEDRYRVEAAENLYHRMMARQGVTAEVARKHVRHQRTLLGALLVHRNEADALICGTQGNFSAHLGHLTSVIGLQPGLQAAATVGAIVLDRGVLFLCDTAVSDQPSPEQLAQIAVLGAGVVRRFGLTPRVALVSHSHFGSSSSPSATRMAEALARIRDLAPGLAVEGEMNALAALEPDAFESLPDSALRHPANLLVMPSLDAAHIGFDLLRGLTRGQAIGPIAVGLRAPAHVLGESVSPRGILNMSAYAAVEACRRAAAPGLHPTHPGSH